MQPLDLETLGSLPILLKIFPNTAVEQGPLKKKCRIFVRPVHRLQELVMYDLEIV